MASDITLPVHGDLVTACKLRDAAHYKQVIGTVDGPVEKGIVTIRLSHALFKWGNHSLFGSGSSIRPDAEFMPSHCFPQRYTTALVGDVSAITQEQKIEMIEAQKAKAKVDVTSLLQEPESGSMKLQLHAQEILGGHSLVWAFLQGTRADGTKTYISPTFSDLSDLHQWNRENGWSKDGPELDGRYVKPTEIAMVKISDMTTAAFLDLGCDAEVASIFRQAADVVDSGWKGKPTTLKDTNGNPVGCLEPGDCRLEDVMQKPGEVIAALLATDQLASQLRSFADQFATFRPNEIANLHGVKGNVVGKLAVGYSVIDPEPHLASQDANASAANLAM